MQQNYSYITYSPDHNIHPPRNIITLRYFSSFFANIQNKIIKHFCVILCNINLHKLFYLLSKHSESQFISIFFVCFFSIIYTSQHLLSTHFIPSYYVLEFYLMVSHYWCLLISVKTRYCADTRNRYYNVYNNVLLCTVLRSETWVKWIEIFSVNCTNFLILIVYYGWRRRDAPGRYNTIK